MKVCLRLCLGWVNVLWSSRYGRIWLVLAPCLAFCYGTILIVNHNEYIIQAIDILNIPPFYMADVHCDKCNNYNYSYKINHKDDPVCSNQSLLLLFLVTSSPGNTAQRAAIRNTWGNISSYNKHSIHTVFIVGRGDDSVKNKALEHENSVYKDIIQLNMPDNYQSLTNKSIAALQWGVTYCPSAKFLVKTDDDSLNLPHRYVDYLTSSLADFNVDLIAGELSLGHFPKRSSKWKVSVEEYPDKYYPPHCKGRAYIVSRPSAIKLLKVAPNVRFNRMEDVYVTGLCRSQADIPCTDLKSMPLTDIALEDCRLSTDVLNAHYVQPHNMAQLYFTKAMNKTLREYCFQASLLSSDLVGASIQAGALFLTLTIFVLWYKSQRNLKEKTLVAHT